MSTEGTRVLDSKGHAKSTPPIPHGLIIIFSGTTIPDGWTLCDGTDQTPDLTDRFVVGDSAVGVGSSGGTVSATAGLTHAGAAVGAHSVHVVTQAAAHANHVVTQPSNHSDHVVTQADIHVPHAANVTHTHAVHTGAQKVAGAATAILGGSTHAANATHTHDAHSAHTGAALDAHLAHTGADLNAHSAHSGAVLDAHSAHSVTQPSTHAVLKHFLLAYVMKI